MLDSVLELVMSKVFLGPVRCNGQNDNNYTIILGTQNFDRLLRHSPREDDGAA